MTKRLNVSQKFADINFGKKNEDIVKIKLEEHFNKKVKKYSFNYSAFDYYIEDEDGKITDVIELKSRRNCSKVYDTQLIGMNKIRKGKKFISEGVNVYLCFKLTDGLFMYKLRSNDNFKTAKLGNFARNDKASELALIPNDYLSKIDLMVC